MRFLHYGLAPFFYSLQVQKMAEMEVSIVNHDAIFLYLGHLREQVGMSYSVSRKVKLESLVIYIETRVYH